MNGGRHPIRHVQFELTNHCNLQCPYCPNRLMKRPRTFMDEAVYGAVIGRLLALNPEVESVTLSKDGEPLLHPRFQEVLRAVCRAAPQATIDLYTNGLRLEPDIYETLKSLPNRIRLMLTFHLRRYDRASVDYSRMSDRLEYYIDTNPGNIEFILTHHVGWWSESEEVTQWFGRWQGRSGVSAVHENHRIMDWAGRVEGNAHMPYCGYSVGDHIFIGVLGTVLPCCVDLEEEAGLGNIVMDKTHLLEDYRSRFYDQLQAGVRPTGLCERCLANAEDTR